MFTWKIFNRLSNGGYTSGKLTLVFIVVSILNNLINLSTASAIVGGIENPTSSKHAVMILNNNGGMCSAVVIAQTIILTAANCVSNSNDFRVHYRDENNKSVLLKPKNIYVHPEYDPDAISKRRKSIDLAVIALDMPLPSRFTPIEVDYDYQPKLNDIITVEGFGTSDEAPGGGSVKKSLGVYRTAELTEIEPYGASKFLLWMSAPNTTNSEKGIGICFGDSGGASVFEKKLVAINAWSSGNNKRNCGYYSQSTILSPQVEWLKTTIKNATNSEVLESKISTQNPVSKMVNSTSANQPTNTSGYDYSQLEQKIYKTICIDGLSNRNCITNKLASVNQKCNAGIEKIIQGEFIKNENVILADFTSNCSPHSENYGGTFLFSIESENIKFLQVLPRIMFPYGCIKNRNKVSFDQLYCHEGYSGQGYNVDTFTSCTLIKTNDQYSADCKPLIQAESQLGAVGYEEVDCSKPNENVYFGIIKMSLGIAPNAINLRLQYADREIIEKYCAPNAPKIKDSIRPPEIGKAYIKKTKQADFIYFINTDLLKLLDSNPSLN